jgi:ferredoxin
MSFKKKAVIGKDCVACGACVKVCPFNALRIKNGITSVVDEQKCVGCGKCAIACPAAVIEIIKKEVVAHEEKTLV